MTNATAIFISGMVLSVLLQIFSQADHYWPYVSGVVGAAIVALVENLGTNACDSTET